MITKVFEISEDEAWRGKFNRPLYEKFGSDRRMILIKNKMALLVETILT